IIYAAVHNAVVSVGDRSANGAVHTSVGRSPTTRAISTSLSTIQGLKARTIPATFSRVWCISWLELTSLGQSPTIGLSLQRFRVFGVFRGWDNVDPSPLALNSHRNESFGVVVWSGGEICRLGGIVPCN
ncbi:MAG: hypothetical protein GX456_04670, partial [Verrucomicrobia bacterium]|nr:hypothetical protein [Verrucomicrobiota bacterium]